MTYIIVHIMVCIMAYIMAYIKVHPCHFIIMTYSYHIIRMAVKTR